MLSYLLGAALGGCGGGNGAADAAVAGGGPSAGNTGTGGAMTTGGASAATTSSGRPVVPSPDAGYDVATPGADGPVVLPPECVSGTSLGCPCLSGPPGVKVCTEEGRFSACVCAHPTPDAATPDAATADAATAPTTGDTVTFNQGQAVGVMTGYGWPNWGLVGDVVTDPACLGGVSSSSPCTITAPWNSPNALCVSGTIAALATTPTQPNYSGNWGIEIGVYASTDDAAIGMTYTSINVSVSGTPTNVLRVVVHRKGDPLTTQYCAVYTGSAIPFSSFNSACWNGGGVALLAADVPNINWVAVEIPASTTAITVNDLCLNSITFN